MVAYFIALHSCTTGTVCFQLACCSLVCDDGIPEVHVYEGWWCSVRGVDTSSLLCSGAAMLKLALLFPAGLKYQDSLISIYRSNRPLFCLRVQNRRALWIIIVFSITPMVMCLTPAYSCAVHSPRAIGDTCAFQVLELFSFVLARYNWSIPSTHHFFLFR